MSHKDILRSRHSQREDADPGLTQDCVIQWMDDDDRFPDKMQTSDLLFQSPIPDNHHEHEETWKSNAHENLDSAVVTRHLQPLHTQPIVHVENQTSCLHGQIKRRRYGNHRPIMRNEEDPLLDSTRDCGEANVIMENTPVVDASRKKNDSGLLFDLPTCWKEHFQTRNVDTPAENSTNALDTSMAHDTDTSLSQECHNVSSPPLNIQHDTAQNSCRVDLGTIFQNSQTLSNIPMAVYEENYHLQRSSLDVLDLNHNETATTVEFDFINLNDDDMAAVEEAIRLRQATQDLNPPHSLTQSNIDKENIPFSATTETLSKTVMGKPALIGTPTDAFGDFPDIDFDMLDQLVAKRQVNILTLQNPDQPNIVTPVNASKEPEFIQFSRYIICSITENTNFYEKILGVKIWSNINDEFNDFSSNLIRPDGNVHLRGEWYHAKCEPGDVIHICSLSGRYDTSPTAFPIMLNTQASSSLDDNDLLLVVHPDLLVTPTAISETIHCNRRAVLMSRLGSGGLSTKSAMMGTLRHDLFERCLFHKDFSYAFAQTQCTSIIKNHAESLIALDMIDELQIYLDLMKTVPLLQRFSSEYTSFLQPSSDGARLATGSLIPGHGVQSSLHLLIDDVHATEESSVSHEVGLRGFVDATVVIRGRHKQPTIQAKRGGQPSSHALDHPKILVPIELKTGHNQNAQHAHMAQLALYTVMLRARYGSEDASRMGASGSGVLLYLNDQAQQAVHISPSHGEIKSLINQRNVVASEIRRSVKVRGVDIVNDGNRSQRIIIHPPPPSELPDVLYSVKSCERCYSNRECMLYAKSDIIDSDESSNISKTHKDLIEKFTRHLTMNDLKYFREWDRLIDCEAFASNHDIAKSWLVESSDSEQKTGKCISSLIFEESNFSRALGEDDTVLVKLCRSPDAPIRSPINTLKFSIGDVVVLSTDHVSFNNHRNAQQYFSPRLRKMHILKGTIKLLEENHLYLRMSQRDIRQVMNIIKQRSFVDQSIERAVCFRLDKDESTVVTTTLRKNLKDFLTLDIRENPPTDEGEISVAYYHLKELRNFIIDLKKPRFDEIVTSSLFESPIVREIKGCEIDILRQDYANLNLDQKAAVQKVFSCKDYTLIQGLPGSGKTSMISFAARLLVAHGKRVLITSYTHAAVDTLLMKIMEAGVGSHSHELGLFDLVRLGADNQIHEKVQSVSLSNLATIYEKTKNKTGNTESNSSSVPYIQYLHQIMDGARIVGVSTLSVPRISLLSKMNFDIVIVDEAGQISQPAILGALMKGKKFVLVGDHEQLPPLVQSPIAEEGGYGVSMLKRLADAHPYAVAQLTLQYRMNDAICTLCNEVAYKGKLRCANDHVSQGKLQLEGFPFSLSKIKRNWRPGSGVGWLLPIINPNKGVVFIDTDSLVNNPQESQAQWLETSRGREVEGGNMINTMESILSRIIIQGLLCCGVRPDMIGIISPYRSQVKCLDEDTYLSSRKKFGLEISTIDKYQGRDKEVIIVSLVRSNAQGKTGRLLEDYRRLNVAFSRAKHKLIILGSSRTLMRGSSVLGPLVDFMKGKGWIESLPDNALQIYEEPMYTQHLMSN